jgi:hypothetical protein
MKGGGASQRQKPMKIINIFRFILILVSTVLVAFAIAGCSAQPEPPGGITGRVFLDEDADAECDECDCDFYLDGIVIRLYQDNCTGLIHQTVETNEEGIFIFEDLAPGNYCVSPKVKMICEGYQPTTPIQQKVTVLPNETVEAPWFGFDHYLDN